MFFTNNLVDSLDGVQGTEAINGLVTSIDVPADKDSGKYKINFMRYTPGTKAGVKDSEEFDLIIGSDGANSRVAKVNTKDPWNIYTFMAIHFFDTFTWR